MENITEIIKELHTDLGNGQCILMVIVDFVTWQRIKDLAWRQVYVKVYKYICMHVCTCVCVWGFLVISMAF